MEHIVVGGVAAILEGAAITTLDLEIVCRLDDDNSHRLASLLEKVDARHRNSAGRQIRPTLERLGNNRVDLLETRLGPLDVLHNIGPAWEWSDLIARSLLLRVGELEVRVLGLPSIIESKAVADREKGRIMLGVLRRTLEEKKREAVAGGLPRRSHASNLLRAAKLSTSRCDTLWRPFQGE